MNLPLSKFVPTATLKAQIEAMQAQILESEAVEKATAKIIAEIKKANISPSILTALLQAEGLIVGEQSKDEAKIIHISDVITKEGRKSTFKIWEGREVKKLTGTALTYWTSVKTLGQAQFIEKATPEGKAYFETEKGKTWLATAFA